MKKNYKHRRKYLHRESADVTRSHAKRVGECISSPLHSRSPVKRSTTHWLLGKKTWRVRYECGKRLTKYFSSDFSGMTKKVTWSFPIKHSMFIQLAKKVLFFFILYSTFCFVIIWKKGKTVKIHLTQTQSSFLPSPQNKHPRRPCGPIREYTTLTHQQTREYHT